MDSLLTQQHHILLSQISMLTPFISLTSKLLHKPNLPFKLRTFCTTSHHLATPTEPTQHTTAKPTKEKLKMIKEKWLNSLTVDGLGSNNGGFGWVIGVDPDASGALALLKSDHSGITSAQVFDSPIVQVAVGKRFRKRLDARSIVQLIQSFDVPSGTIAYVEQSLPFPRDGKQGWWSGGFGYGLWIGILVASGYSVVPVPSVVWKKEFELARSCSSKDDSRELATELFPNLSSMLKRKKDHGRAEALLIAAYGKGHRIKSEESCVSDMVVKLDHASC